jgi:D-alanyl-D-alanine carboxypeptidase (penicillin-binding protein 5/6)
MELRSSTLVIAAVVLGASPSASSLAADPSGLAEPAALDAVPIALLVDLSAGQTLYAKAADQPFLPASMTKAMTALVAFDLIKAGRLNPATRVTVDPDLAARWAGKGTSLNLRSGEAVTIDELLHGTITVSANDAAEILARHAAGSRAAWVELMNRRARSLGMANSTFANPSGWPDGGRTRVTARDMVRLSKALIEDHPDLYKRYFGHAAMSWRGASLHSRNPFAERVAGADGIKTGHTREAGYTFLGSAVRDGRRLVLVVGGAPSEELRASGARSLLEWGYTAWSSYPLLQTGQQVGEVRVQQGDARSVTVAPARDWRIAMPVGTARQVSTRIVYRGPVQAPVRQGQVVAGLEVSIDGLPPHDIPLLANRTVNRAGPFDRLLNGLLGLFQ